jgi:hypothetical protein
MADFSATLEGRTGARSPERSTADALEKAVRMLRDGTISMADFFLISTIEGAMAHFDVGTATTPITFKTGFTAAQPELVVDVDDGYTIIPACLQVQLEDSAGTDNEIVAQASKGTKIGAGASTAITGRNANTGDSLPTGVSCYSAYSGNGTAPTTPAEFWRWGSAFADANTLPPRTVAWFAKDFAPVVIKGPGALALYIGGTTTAPAGFAKASVVVLPSTLLY